MALQLLGLDGCKDGAWVAATAGPEFRVVQDLQPLLAHAQRGHTRLVLDVPIGLAPSGRRCDAEARELLKHRRSSVFTPPCRPALAGNTRAEPRD